MARSGFAKVDFRIGDYYGCDDTAKFFHQLMYWGDKKPQGFYKFMDRCKTHQLYRQGDSWGEELNMSRRTVKRILSRLVTHHKTKTDFDRTEDKFNGKLFASYTNRRTHKTYYFVNWEAVQTFLTSISAYIPSFVKKHFSTISPISQAAISQEVSAPSSAAFCMSNGRSTNAQNGRSLTHAHQINSSLQTNTTLDPDVPKVAPPSLSPEPEEVKLSLEMKEIWNTKQPNKLSLYPSQAKNLCKVLRERFNNSLDAFKQYCDAIASSDFLTGKADNSDFKAYFWWAIKPENISTIRNGGYGVKKDEVSANINLGPMDSIKTIEDVRASINALNEDHLAKQFRHAAANNLSIQKYKAALFKQNIFAGSPDGHEWALYIEAPHDFAAQGILANYAQELGEILGVCDSSLRKIIVCDKEREVIVGEIRRVEGLQCSILASPQPQRTSFEGNPYAILN